MRVRDQIRTLACLCALYASLAGTVNITAQQAGVSSAQQASGKGAGTYAIRNARIVTLSGPEIENGTIVIRDGKIEAVGAGVSVPTGAQEIDARGLSVYPGMIDAGTALGLLEIDLGVPAGVDIS